ncbi:hypothetical protein BASA81_004223 [Batrachochytrium salamandrivorans]|nr:hypothetical protein BASA81_004223 [Batrachochytrium salamandrivorans]
MTTVATGYPRNRFLGEGFSAREFVNSQLSGMGEEGLDLIVENLKATVQDLTDQLLALIDRDHQTFLELSGDLVRVDSTVGTLRGPLANLKQKIQLVSKLALAPGEISQKYDLELEDIRKRKQVVKQRIFSREAKKSVERNLTAGKIHRAAQRVALLSRVDDELDSTELRRKVELLLLDKLFQLTDEVEIGKRLQSLVMMNGVESTRRTLQLHLQNQPVLSETLMLQQFTPLLRAVGGHHLGTVFEFPKHLLILGNRSKPITTSTEYRQAELTRQRFSHLSPTATPHVPVHWNPRAHCELRFQDASEVLGDTLASLRLALDVLWKQDQANDVLLDAHLFRMSVKLVMGYLNQQQQQQAQYESGKEQAEDDTLMDRTRDVFELKRLLDGGEGSKWLMGQSANNNALEINITSSVTDKLADRANTIGQSFIAQVQYTCVESSSRELSAHERSVTSKYRMSGKELDQVESPTAGRILARVFDCLDVLIGVGLDHQILIDFSQAIVHQVAVQYLTMAETVVRRETSLLKLHQSRNANSTVMSDSHKIVKQLAMDANRFVSDVSRLFSTKLNTNYSSLGECEQIVQVLNAF